MPYSILLLCRRKEGLTPAEFKDYFETHHVLLIKKLTGEYFPETHQRYYIERDGQGNFPARMLVGDDMEYDAVCVMTWAEEPVAQKYFAKVQEPDAFKQVMDDDARFVDRASTKLVVFGDLCVTTRA